MQIVLEQLIIFVTGIAIGSFLNAVIWRTRHGKSIFHGRSQCIHCDRRLLWHDLVPLLSFILQRGKCRYCSKKISWQYPIIESVTSLLFLIIWNFSPQVLNCDRWIYCHIYIAIYLFFITSILLVTFVSDLRYSLLPTSILLLGLGVSFVVNILLGILWYNLLLGIVVGFAFFAIQYFASKGKWIGDGDMFLGAMMGAVLGFPNILYAITLAYILGAIVAIFLLITKKANWKSKLPLGVFLTLSAFIIMFL